MDGGVVKENTVGQFAVVAQGFSVIGGDSNQDVVVQTLFSQIIKQLAYRRIHVGDAPVIRGFRKLAAERFGWIVGVVRIPQVEPQEKGATLLLVEPFERVSQGHFAAALHRSLAALAGLLPVKACVVDIEAALESGGKPIFRIEDDATDKCPCVIALGVQNLGKEWNAGRQAIAEVADGVVLRKSPGEYSRVRNRRDRGLRVSMFKHHPLAR